ncbi:MAG: endonuclease domain-containing protein [Anaerolineae bacterium]|jgi:very-short-patch-repair endonuclease
MPKRQSIRAQANIRERARELRKEQTPTEILLWQHLRGRQLLGLKFRRQHPVGRFIADFYCAEYKLVIEIDGPVHDQHPGRDEERDEILSAQGHTVLHFTNTQVEQDLPGVLAHIAAACNKHP